MKKNKEYKLGEMSAVYYARECGDISWKPLNSWYTIKFLWYILSKALFLTLALHAYLWLTHTWASSSFASPARSVKDRRSFTENRSFPFFAARSSFLIKRHFRRRISSLLDQKPFSGCSQCIICLINLVVNVNNEINNPRAEGARVNFRPLLYDFAEKLALLRCR